MSEFQIKNFIMFYERLTKHMLKNLSKKSDFVINIDKKTQIEIYSTKLNEKANYNTHFNLSIF